MELIQAHLPISFTLLVATAGTFFYLLKRTSKEGPLLARVVYSLLVSSSITGIIWLLAQGRPAEFVYILIFLWPLVWILHERLFSKQSEAGDNHDNAH